MQSIDMAFVQNLLVSFQELQRSHADLQKRMAEFEAKAAAKFEAYEAKIAEKDATIASLKATIAKQEAELEKYREKDKTNSANSGMSPSKDVTKAANKGKSKNKSGKKQGAQPGHEGSGLSLPSHYDREEISSLTPKPCQGCPARFLCSGLSCSRVRETRYEVDVTVQVVLHKYEQLECQCPRMENACLCGTFPDGINATVQYGQETKALAAVLLNEGAVSVIRTHDILSALAGVPVSTGSIIAWNYGLADDLKEPHVEIRDKLLSKPVSHSDETSMNVGGENWWVHVACDGLLTYMTVNKSRGYAGVAAAGFMTQYTGISVSDCWATYNMFGQLSGHGRCCAHILRELQKVIDTHPELVWAKYLQQTLLDMKAAKERAIAKGKKGMSKSSIYRHMKAYDLWIWSGKKNTPSPKVNEETGKKEAKSYARRLVERLEKYRDEVCLFFTNFIVPFDNNQAERDLRPVKTKMKVSGVMRTERGAEAYVVIRSFISTAKKHGTNLMVALRLAFSGRAREAICGVCT